MKESLHVPSGFSRRDLLRYSLAGSLVVGAGGLLTACNDASPNTQGRGGPPKKGGILTVGMVSGGRTESVDPATAYATNDYMRVINLYDTLFEYDDELNVGPALAERGEPNKDFTVWTLHLRKGVTFHDGSPFTADDVIVNFQGWTQPTAFNYGLVGYEVDPKKLRKIDAHTVEVGLIGPNARFDRSLAFLVSSIKSKNETKGGNPIGTGPFKFKSFTPGARSEFVRFEDHWRKETAYVDTLVINSSFTDENTRTNAFNSGQLDVLPLMSFGLAGTLAQGKTLLRAPSGAFNNFYMRVDAAPFNDVRVRQAMRLLVDRQQMVDVAYGGYGSVSNDVPGRHAPYYDDSLVREQDVDQAKFLLNQAGFAGSTITLQTSTVYDSFTNTATLFKQQAKAVGINVELEQVDPSAYFDQTTNYGKMPFAQTVYYPVPSLDQIWVPSFLNNTPINETHWYASDDYAKSQQLFAASKATEDEGKLTDLWAQLQLQQFESGGYINYGTYDYIDGLSERVQGLTPSKYLFSSGCNFRKAWVSA